MTQWRRGLDRKGRIFTIGIDGDAACLYFPNEDGEDFRVADGSYATRIGDGPVKYMVDRFPKGQLEETCEKYQIVLPVPSRRKPGEYFPRIWLGPETPHPKDVGLLESWLSSVRSSRALFAHLRDVFRTIEPVRAHANVHGHELRQLLILACTEVESAWKAILRANGYSPKKGDRYWSRRDYKHLLDPLALDIYTVRLSSYPRYGELTPFEPWRTNGLPWYEAYNKVKHDREEELGRATLGHVIDAMAAVSIMVFVQFGRLTVDPDAYFHADEFTPVRYPRGVLDPGIVVGEGRTSNPPEIGDWYIRPLPKPSSNTGSWPTQWVEGEFPAIRGAAEKQ